MLIKNINNKCFFEKSINFIVIFILKKISVVFQNSKKYILQTKMNRISTIILYIHIYF